LLQRLHVHFGYLDEQITQLDKEMAGQLTDDDLGMALGLVNRSAQQLNVFFLSMPIKSAFALLMPVMSLGFAFKAPLEQSSQWVKHVLTLMDHLR
jgi:type III secretory pathway component EscT